MAIRADASQQIDKYILRIPEFARPICKKLRQIIHAADSEIVEDWKWGPNFNKNGMVCGFGAFKAHVTLTFFKGTLLKDRKKILEDCSGSNAHNRSIKFASIEDIDEKTLLAYLKEAVVLNSSGIKVERRRAPIAMPPDLKKALAISAKARKTFEAFTPGYQREYIEWVVQAKRPETRQARIKTAISLCADGKSLNWKYKR